MKIALIDTTGDVALYAIRLISALLKKEKHTVTTLFLLPHKEYDSRVFTQVHEVLKDVDLAMVSVYSFSVSLAIRITDYIHRNFTGMKVIWGGPHCVAAPELSLQHADGVCFAEGDQAVIELVAKMEAGEDYTAVKNMAFMINGAPKINDLFPPFSDLDSLPMADFNTTDQFFLDDCLKPLKKRDMCFQSPWSLTGAPTLSILMARGCPFKCTYCNNICYINMYGRNPIRYRSIEYAFIEIEHILNLYPFYRWIFFTDDDFLLRSTKNLEQFAAEYKRRFNLPFMYQASANTFNRKKLEIVLDAGGNWFRLGLQSGSQRILDDVFKRPVSIRKTKQVLQEIKPLVQEKKLILTMDFIVDNPYETEKDIVESYKFICDLPHMPIQMKMFKLVFFPGTPIYEMAKKDGFISGDDDEVSRRYSTPVLTYQKNYPLFMLYLARSLFRKRLLHRIPQFILFFLVSPPVLLLMRMLPKAFWVKLISRFGRKRRHLYNQKWNMLSQDMSGEAYPIKVKRSA